MLINQANVIPEQSEEISATNSPQKEAKPRSQPKSDIIITVNSDTPNTKIIPFIGRNNQRATLEAGDSNQPSSRELNYLMSPPTLKETSEKKQTDVLQVQNSHIAFTRIDSNQPEQRPKVFHREIENYYLSLFLSSENAMVVKQEMGKECCLFRLLYIFNSKYTLSNDLTNEREYFFFLSRIQFDPKFELHVNIINTIFYAFNEEFIIKHSTGMFLIEEMMERLLLHDNTSLKVKTMSVLPLAYSMMVIDKYHQFLTANLDKLINKATGFNYFFLLIKDITEIMTDIIRTEKLVIYFNQKKSVSNTMNEFFLGLLEQSMIELTPLLESMAQMGKELIEIIGLRLRSLAFDFPSTILWKYKIFIKKYPEDKDSVSFDSISYD